MGTEDIKTRLMQYMESQISVLAKTNPTIGFIKPLLTRALHNKISGIDNWLKLIADESGNIDIIEILEEMIDSVTHTQPFVMDIPVLGKAEIGGGNIKVNLPFIGKLLFNSSDLLAFKNFMLGK